MTEEDLGKLLLWLRMLEEAPGLYCPLRDKAAALRRQLLKYSKEVCDVQ